MISEVSLEVLGRSRHFKNRKTSVTTVEMSSTVQRTYLMTEKGVAKLGAKYAITAKDPITSPLCVNLPKLLQFKPQDRNQKLQVLIAFE